MTLSTSSLSLSQLYHDLLDKDVVIYNKINKGMHNRVKKSGTIIAESINVSSSKEGER